MGVFKVFLSCKSIFKVDIKSLILPQLISLLCLYCNIRSRFYLLSILDESEVADRRSSVKKVLLQITQGSQKITCTGVPFAIALQAEGLQLH